MLAFCHTRKRFEKQIIFWCGKEATETPMKSFSLVVRRIKVGKTERSVCHE